MGTKIVLNEFVAYLQLAEVTFTALLLGNIATLMTGCVVSLVL